MHQIGIYNWYVFSQFCKVMVRWQIKAFYQKENQTNEPSNEEYHTFLFWVPSQVKIVDGI